MSMLTETLTINIVGDSSRLQQELERITQQVSGLGARFKALYEVDSGLGQLSQRLAMLTSPLQSLSRLVGQVQGQLQSLSRTPVTLNVSPAVSALAALGRMADSVAARLRAVSAGMSSGGGTPFSPGQFPVRMARGGLVYGAGGIDQVPAWLSAGEFVLRQPVVEKLGVSFLNALNQRGDRPGTAAPVPVATSPAASSTVTNLGGVNIHVAQAVDFSAVMRDLRGQGFALRNRRG